MSITPLLAKSPKHIPDWIVFLAALTLTNISNVHAQVDAGALQQGLEKQLPSVSPLGLPTPSSPLPPKAEPSGTDGVQIVVQSFELEGVKTLSEEKVQQALMPWRGNPVSFGDLQKACDAVAQLYQKNGYTVQVTLPPQKIANGVVKILVTEAKLGAVLVDTPQGETRFSKDLAAQYITYANPIGEVLNGQSLERAIIILNETPGVMVAAALEPGENDGETAVRLQLTQPALFDGSLGVNNYGSRTTGANQGVIGLLLNNPMGYGDSLGINGIYSEGSQYLQGNYSFPGSKDGLRLGASGTYLQYKNVSNYAANGGAGDAWTTGLSAAYPLIRSRGLNANTSLNYDIKSYNNRNTITNNVTSAYNINDLTLGLSGNFYDPFIYGAITNVSASLVWGQLNMIETSQTVYTPSNFTKATFNANRNQALTDSDTTSLSLSASGQLASVNLNSAEQFYLGGPYGVRAYPVSQGGGSQGGIFSAELKHKLLDNLSISTFFDAGVVQQYKNTYTGWQSLTNANNTYSLMGAGFGAKWNYEACNLGAIIAWKVGQNPLYSYSNGSYRAVNVDGTTTNPRAWVTASCQM